MVVSSATPQDAGLASGLVNTTAQVCGAPGLAVLATVSASRTCALIVHDRPVAVVLTDGYHLAFWIAFGLMTAAIADRVRLSTSPPEGLGSVGAVSADFERRTA